MLLGIKIFKAGETLEREVEKPFASTFFFADRPNLLSSAAGC
jgi:hypothetical protein